MIINQMGTIKFQLTPSRRATAAAPTIMQIIHFNSRPHGGRQRQPQPLCRLYISTHALTEGDRNSSDPAESLENFNSRPHGGRHGNFFLISVCVAFQLTPSRRATWRTSFRLRTRELFQLTPSRRATANLDKFFF